MAYEKQTWEDRQVENPLTFTQINNLDGSITLTPYPGVVQSEGSKMSAERFNHMEEGIYNNSILIEKTVLYESQTGSKGEIELTDMIENYKEVKIFFHYENIYGSSWVFNPSGKVISLSVVFSISVYNLARIQYKNIKITQNKVINEGFGYLSINTEGKTDVDIRENEIFIDRIVGYK